MTKVVHKKVSQCCNKIRRSESKKGTQPLHNIKMMRSDIKQKSYLKKNGFWKKTISYLTLDIPKHFCPHNVMIQIMFYQNWLINKSAKSIKLKSHIQLNNSTNSLIRKSKRNYLFLHYQMLCTSQININRHQCTFYTKIVLMNLLNMYIRIKIQCC